MRSFTLKFANIYTNTDKVELLAVIDQIIPMCLDDCMESMIDNVRVFGLHMLAEIIRSTNSESMVTKLKINTKLDR